MKCLADRTATTIALSALLCLPAIAAPRDVVDPSAHPGMGAIPYGGSGCQVWRHGTTDWSHVGTLRPDLDDAGNGSVRWTIPLASMGLASGDVVRFDVATSDADPGSPGVDHLSRSDIATPNWKTPSVAGEFLEYQVTDTPGSETYVDTFGDVFAHPNLDIMWAIVGHDATNLYLTVKVNGDLVEEDWANFLIFLDLGAGGSQEHPWGRPIDLNGVFVDAFLGSWIDNAQSGVSFRTWAPNADAVSLIGDFNGWTLFATMLADEGDGLWSLDVANSEPGQQYKFVFVNNGVLYTRNDSHARDLTSSVGNSVIHDRDSYIWTTLDWTAPSWNRMVIYELHVGTFSGGLLQAIPRLDHLVELGINAIELMPIWEFAGEVSWGYNAGHPWAVESDYGTPDDLKRFVDACHGRGIVVLLDVLYNHWGPQDMDLWRYDGWSENDLGGIYFYNDWRAETPWGDTRPDFGRLEVRTFIRDNVMHWLDEYRFDGLRVDGVQWIRTESAGGAELPDGWSLLRWINDEVDVAHPVTLVIAEDMAASEWITKGTGAGGAGFDTQWDPLFVHPVRGNLITPSDADRSMWAIRDAILASYNGQYLQRVIYTESHDEVANGNSRLPEEITPGDAGSWYARKRSTLGAALALTSPGIPMLFQGQEFLEDGYFDDDDPLDWSKAKTFSGILSLYKDLVALRTDADGVSGGLSGPSTNVHHVNDAAKVLAYHRWDTGGPGDDIIVVMNFTNTAREDYRVGFPHGGTWYAVLNSDSLAYGADYSAIGGDVVAGDFDYDAMAYSAVMDIGPYSCLIYSQEDLPQSCPADLNGDGAVSVADVLAIIAAWGTPEGDVTGNGTTDVADLLVAIAGWGPCP